MGHRLRFLPGMEEGMGNVLSISEQLCCCSHCICVTLNMPAPAARSYHENLHLIKITAQPWVCGLGFEAGLCL